MRRSAQRVAFASESAEAGENFGSGLESPTVNREYHRWHSPSLGRDMELLVFGHAGARVMVFPTSMGRFGDWEDRGMFAAVADFLDQGWFQFFCLDSVDAESWYARAAHPAQRAKRHLQYDAYVQNEVLPWSAERNPHPFVSVTGASFGAYHAVNFALRHPQLVGRVLGMSGLYDTRGFTNGYVNDDIYFNNPCEYLANEHQPERLAVLRKLDIILTIGREDPALLNNYYLSGILWSKGIWHALRVWDGFAHDWPWWQKMLRMYLGGHD